MLEPIIALSPLDGRYREKIEDLSDYFSEFGLFKYRVKVEVEWLIHLCNEVKLKNTRELNEDEVKFLQDLQNYFDVVSAQKVKSIEKETNHDVKAVEYFIKESLSDSSLKDMAEFVHFGLTSEDVNNTAYALMLNESRELISTEKLGSVIDKLREIAKDNNGLSMLSLTHGQTASPTTLGKEMINFVARLETYKEKIDNHKFSAKLNGATGNFNAHTAAAPSTDWPKVSEDFLKKLKLKPNLYTTQIEPHDNTIEYLLLWSQINTILLDFSRDIWMYISRNIFKQKLKEGEVGSSTMPHKVNPIDFENAEGNLGLANSLIYHLAQKLPVSRMQRDLSDSTVFRNLGVVLGYTALALASLDKGIKKLEVNKAALAKELKDNPEVLAEAIQTVMRIEGIEQPYEKLKQLTRGKKITPSQIKNFIEKLDINSKTKKKLLNLTPDSYTGLASTLTQHYLKKKS